MQMLKLLVLFLVIIQLHATNEKHFVIIIPSFNNQDWVERNLESVFTQEYQNYSVIYIDDCSTDSTAAKAQECIEKNNQQPCTQLICNKQRRGALANLYHAIHACNNTDIIVCLDGDDWLENTQVLTTLSNYYISDDIWLTYGQYQVFPGFTKGICSDYSQEIIKTNSFRQDEQWRASHLRTFYAGLFKQIKLEDLLYNGQFLPVAWDLGFMFPMLEMCAGKFAFTPDCFYVYNRSNPLNDFRINEHGQIFLDMLIRSKLPYQPVATYNPSEQQQKADILIFSHDHPSMLAKFLYALKRHVKNIGTIVVLYIPTYYPWKPETTSYEKQYHERAQKIKDVIFIKTTCQNFAADIKKALNYCTHDYCLLTHDTAALRAPIDLAQCTAALEKTKAYAFYCQYNQSDIDPEKIIVLEETMIVWQQESLCTNVYTQNNFLSTLYRKETVQKLCKHQAHCAEALEYMWSLTINNNYVGIAFAKAPFQRKNI